MGGLSYARHLETLNLYFIKGRLLRADLLKAGIQPTDLFELAPDVGIRGHRFKLEVTHSSINH